MKQSRFGLLVEMFEQGKISRRELGKRAAVLGATSGAVALGVSVGSAGLAARHAEAQEARDAGFLTGNNEQTNAYIRNFNPLGPAGGSIRWLTQFGMYEPLFIWNTLKSEQVPWLAESWEFNADNTQLTFKLRKGVTWSDGKPFTAKDVEFTWSLFQKFEDLGGNGGRTAIVDLDSIEATDDLTVVFTFKNVNTPLVNDIGGQVIVPEHIWKDVKDPVKETNEKPVATGPFTEVVRFDQQIYALGLRDNYWNPDGPTIKGIRVPAYPSNDPLNLALINGELDWTANFVADIDTTFVAKDPEHFAYFFPPVGATVALYMNHTVAPFDDIAVRKAISMAINRQQICDVAMYGYTHPADTTGLSDAFESQKDKDAANAGWCDYDVDAANKLLDDAGYAKDGDLRKTKDGKTMSYKLNVVSGWSDWVQSVQIIADSLKEIGIEATVTPLDYTPWVDQVNLGKFEMSIGWGFQGPTVVNTYRALMSTETFRKVGENTGENWSRFKSTDADAALKAFTSTSDEAKQQEASVKLQHIFAESALCAPLFPGPQWGEYNSTRFTGFPDADNPYCVLSTWSPEAAIVLRTIKAVAS